MSDGAPASTNGEASRHSTLRRPFKAVSQLTRWGLTRFVWLRSVEVAPFARVIGGRVSIEGPGSIRIGKWSRLNGRFAPISLTSREGAEINVGSNVGMNFGTSIDARELVEIGDDVSFGPYCVVTDHSADDVAPVRIGDGVWLATRVTVLPGSVIGAKSVVAAGSIVDGEIPSGVLAGGIPARTIRRLDDADDPTAQAVDLASTAPEQVAADDEPSVPREPLATGLLISDFTIDPLVGALAQGPELVDAAIGPFGAIGPSLLSPPDGNRDFAVVWTDAESSLPSISRVQDGEDVSAAEIEAEVDRFVALLEAGSAHFDLIVVPEWVKPPWDRGRGPLDRLPGGLGYAYEVANQALRRGVGQLESVVTADTRRWTEQAGVGAFSARGWYEGRIPFSYRMFEAAADEICATIAARRRASRKVLVLDLDNTVWGGVVGDDGADGLRLGGHDPVGEAFADFQRRALALSRRGILLTIASKNEESVALQAIDELDTMVLRRSDFVAWRINWNDKAQSIAEMAAELNLGLQSFVFIDDNPHERARVAEALPEVLVPDWPEDPMSYVQALGDLTCFDTLALTNEDLERTQQYHVEAERQQARAVATSLEDFVRELEIEVTARPLESSSLQRAAQLLNKTNQMNLRTRRLSADELWAWSQQDGHQTWCVWVSDRLGDAGLTGVVSVSTEGQEAQLDDFLMSCRVMGRQVERTMVAIAAKAAGTAGANRLVAEVIPTSKNAPCVTFFEGLDAASGEARYALDVSVFAEVPDAINLTTPDNA